MVVLIFVRLFRQFQRSEKKKSKTIDPAQKWKTNKQTNQTKSRNGQFPTPQNGMKVRMFTLAQSEKMKSEITIIMILAQRAPNKCQFALMIIYWRLFVERNSNGMFCFGCLWLVLRFTNKLLFRWLESKDKSAKKGKNDKNRYKWKNLLLFFKVLCINIYQTKPNQTE